MVTARDAIARLVAASERIAAWDSEFTPAPYHLHAEASDALQQLDAAERDHIVGMLADVSAFVRREAAHACGVLRLGQAREALLRGLRDEDHDTRDACASALLCIAPTTTLASIADAGTAISSYIVDRAAVEALDTLGASVVDCLVRAGHTPSVIVTGDNVWYRLYDRYRDVVNPVLERGIRGGTFEWCYGTLLLLRRKGGDAWVRPALTWLAQNGDERLSRMATEVLGAFGDSSTIDTMLEVLRTSADARQRAATVTSVLETARTLRIPIAARVIDLLHRAERAALMSALVALGDAPWEAGARDAIAGAIRSALGDADEELVTLALRAASAQSLDVLAPDVIATLGHPRWYGKQMCDARDEYTRRTPGAASAAMATAIERGMSAGAVAYELATNSAHALSRMPDAAHHAPLFRRALAVRGPSKLRCAAACALGVIGDTAATSELAEMARTGSADEAHEAIRALARVGDARCVDIALERIAVVLEGGAIPDRAEEAWLCAVSVDAFAAFISDLRAADALRKCLRHPEMRMRRDAVIAIGRTGVEGALEWVRPLADDPERQVRDAAKRALEPVSR